MGFWERVGGLHIVNSENPCISFNFIFSFCFHFLLLIYVAEKRIVSKLSKISIPNFGSTNFFKVLVLSDNRRDDPYMNDNRNFFSFRSLVIEKSSFNVPAYR